MEDPKPPVAPNEQLGNKDDTQAQILKELKRQNALLEEQLVAQREEKRKEDYRIKFEKEKQFRRFINYWESSLKQLNEERTLHSRQLQHMQDCPQWFQHQTDYMGSAEITPYEHEQARIYNEGVTKRIKDYQDKVESLTKEINFILSGVLKGKYKLSIGAFGTHLVRV
jgi:hypothetical protein